MLYRLPIGDARNERVGGESDVRLTRKIIAVCLAVTGSMIMVAVTITPQQADTNIAAWLKVLGVSDPPAALVTSHADQIAFWIGLGMTVIAVFAISEWRFGKWWRRRQGEPLPMIYDDHQPEPQALPSPFKISDALGIACLGVTDKTTMAGKTDLVSIALAVEITNAHAAGKTLKNVRVYISAPNGRRQRMMLGNSTNDIDLHHLQPVWLEIGHVLLIASETKLRPQSDRRRAVSLNEINDMYAPNRDWRRIKIALVGWIFRSYKNGHNEPFQLTISAEDVPSLQLDVEPDLFADDMLEWLKVAKA